MKRIINVLSLLVIAGVLVGIAALHGNAPGEFRPGVEAAPFGSFPIGQPREVGIAVSDDEFQVLSPREKADQYRDWLLFAAASAGPSTPEELNEATFDRPAVRYGFMRSVGNLEFGEIRSVFVGRGLVVALVPAGRSPEERLDHLGQIADQHRKNLGQMPDSIAVFEYAFASDSLTARITRHETVPARTLFTPEGAYVEAQISSLEDMKTFLGQIDDVTYGQLDGGVLVLGGRKLRGRSFRGIRVEDVAAIWRSASTEDTQGSGFSLDPEYDYEELARFYDDELGPALEFNSQAGLLPLTTNQVRAAGEALHGRDAEPLFGLMSTLRESGDLRSGQLADLLLGVVQEKQFQKARYDGSLQGTEVGMVLFYTDLLAKLWAINYMGSTPQAAVPDFHAMTRRSISPVFREQVDSLSNTRLWFGPQDAGFQLGPDGNSLLMERNATRVYAASASGFTPGTEAPANAQSEAFLGWWNDHYEEIARYEPEYERLNEIMKWSLLAGWLHTSGSGALDFLLSVPVDRSSWFPEWVNAHPELRFKDWSRVGFFPRSYKGTATEAMPQLVSEQYSLFDEPPGQLAGGVSLGGKQTFQLRPQLSDAVSPLRRRSTLSYGYADDGTAGLTTIDGGAYRFASPGRGRVSVVTSPGEKVRFRNAHGELAKGDVERILRKEGAGLHVETMTGGKALGELRVSPTPNGFQVAWRGRDIARGQSLARRISVSGEPDLLVGAADDVAEAYRIEGTGEYLVRMGGSRQWIKVAREPVNTVEMPAGWDARVSDAHGRPQLIAWMDDARARAELADRPHATLREPEASVPPSPVRGDYRYAAREAVRDLAGFRARGERHLHEMLARSDQYAETQRFDAALAVLDDLDAAYARRPEVVMRRAVVELGRKRPSAAADVLRTAPPGRLANRAAVFDEINARIGYASGPEQEGLHAVARVLDWNDLRAAGRVEDRLVPLRDGDGLVLRLETRTLSPGPADETALDRVTRGEALLYVQDSPGLNNLDWSPRSFGRTLDEVISGRRGRLGSLQRGDLSHFRPHRIYAEEPRTEYRLRSSPASATRPYRAYQDENDCEEQEPHRTDGECRRVYVVTLN